MILGNFMPFKTRKHKISASGRHTITFDSSAKVAYDKPSTKHAEVTSKESPSRKKESQSIESSYDFVKSELGKILLLAGLIIGLQVALKYSPILSLL